MHFLAAEASASSGNWIIDVALQYGLAGLVIAAGGWLLYKIAIAYLNQTNERFLGYQTVLADKDKKIEESNEKRHSAALAAVEGLNASTEKLEGIHELLKDMPEALARVSGLTDRVGRLEEKLTDQEELLLGLYDAQDFEPPAKWRRRRR